MYVCSAALGLVLGFIQYSLSNASVKRFISFSLNNLMQFILCVNRKTKINFIANAIECHKLNWKRELIKLVTKILNKIINLYCLQT